MDYVTGFLVEELIEKDTYQRSDNRHAWVKPYPLERFSSCLTFVNRSCEGYSESNSGVENGSVGRDSSVVVNDFRLITRKCLDLAEDHTSGGDVRGRDHEACDSFFFGQDGLLFCLSQEKDHIDERTNKLL